MHFTNFFSTATLALTANAFLIPQEIADQVQEAKAAVEHKAANVVPSLFDHNSQSLSLDCSSCPFALDSERNGAHEWTNDVESSLKMDFATKDKHLTLNGKPFYPVTINDLPGDLHVPQNPSKDSQSKLASEGYHGDLKLSYTLEISYPVEVDGQQLVTVIMSILGLDGEMVKVDDVEVKAIKEADGSLYLVEVNSVPASSNDADAQCTNMMCRVMTKLGAAMAKARAKAASAATATSSAAKKVKCFCMRCFHRMAGQSAAAVGDGKTTHLPTHNHVRPGHFGAPHRHHGHRHGFIHAILAFTQRMFTFVILPVMVGVAVGITASAVGMLVGQAVVFLWLKYRLSKASRQGTYAAVESDDKEDGLPAYDAEALPAYVDVEDKKDAEQEKA